MKPSEASEGHGIRLVQHERDLLPRALGRDKTALAQVYVDRPLLLRDNKKFDLRVYVLVTSFNPLEAFLYREGFGRFTTKRYSLAEGELADQQVRHSRLQ